MYLKYEDTLSRVFRALFHVHNDGVVRGLRHVLPPRPILLDMQDTSPQPAMCQVLAGPRPARDMVRRKSKVQDGESSYWQGVRQMSSEMNASCMNAQM